MRQRLITAFGAVLILLTIAMPRAAMAEHWRAVLVAGDTAQPVFDNAVRAVAAWLVEHGVAEADIHRLAASAGGRNRAIEPATLRQVLGRIASLQSGPGDGCFVFITSHGGRGLGIYLSREDEMLDPKALARALDQGCASVPTVVIVSGCYSGSFARPPMAAPNRIVLTAARADRSSFGCAADRTYTDYDACLLGSLAHATSWQTVFTETKDCVSRREHQLGETASLPQAAFGAAVRDLALQF
ncbi:MAG TPA: C13 family peptidase [Stellaceae bacterium]|nr:C13 family peptidase [Stellaceae bacterium]